MSEVTKADLAEMRSTVMDALAVMRSEMNRGIDGMHKRQDKTNGHVLELQVDMGRHDERIEALEDIEKVRHHVTGKALEAANLRPERLHSEAMAITRREVGLVAGTVTGTVTAMYALLKFLRFLP